MQCSERNPVFIGFEVALAGKFMLSGSEKGTSWQGLAQLESGSYLILLLRLLRKHKAFSFFK